MKQISVPRSSRTRLSNSAILLRRRVVSSREGSSLERRSLRILHHADVRHGRTSMLDRQFRTHKGQSMDTMRRTNKGASAARTRPSWMQRWQGRFLSHCSKMRTRRGEQGKTDFAFGGVAVETGLCGAVAPALAVIVYGEVEIHDFAFELDGREGVRGHGDRERKKEVLCGGVDMEIVQMGGRGH